jgi:hypothetical protein
LPIRIALGSHKFFQSRLLSFAATTTQ